jgi:hypothetical protein
VAPTPQPELAIADGTRPIELDPDHHMGYGHRAIAYTILPIPDAQKALDDIDRSIEPQPVHDAEAYKMRPVIHEYIGNEAEQDRQLER